MKNLCLTFFGLIISVSAAIGQPSPGKNYQLEKSLTAPSQVEQWYLEGEGVIAVREGEMQWLSEGNGAALSFPPGYLKTVFSDGGRFFAVLSLRQESGDTDGNRILEAEVYSSERQKRYSLSLTQYYDEPYPVIAVSDRDGSLVLARITTGELFFYSQSGGLTRKLLLFPQAAYDLERVIHLAISRDGSAVAIAATEHGLKPLQAERGSLSAAPYLFSFTSDGQMRWQKAAKGAMISGLAVSADGNLIAAGSYTPDADHPMIAKSTVYNRAGKPLAQADMLFKSASYSSDSRSLLLADKRSVLLLDIPAGSVAWKKEVPPQEGMISAARLSGDGQTAVLLIAENEFRNNRFIFTNPVMKVMNAGGELLQNMDLAGQEFITPALHVSENGSLISAGFINNYQTFRVK
ncbi:MAG: hypothetical protein P8184_03630 [Calditrichia bacterium]